jgi:hypothetical protein
MLSQALISRHAGLDRVKLWHIKTQHELSTPEHGWMLRGPPSAVVWVRRRDDLRSLLAFGTGLGFLVLWRQVVRKDSVSSSNKLIR